MKINSLPTLQDIETLNCDRVTEYSVFDSISHDEYDVFSIKFVEKFVLDFDSEDKEEFTKAILKRQELIEKGARVRYFKVVKGVLTVTVII